MPDEDNPPQEEIPNDIPEAILPSEEPQQPEDNIEEPPADEIIE